MVGQSGFESLERYLVCQNGGAGKAFPKISKARDGLREAHRDVLVAVFGKAFPVPSSTITTRLGPKPEHQAPKTKSPLIQRTSGLSE